MKKRKKENENNENTTYRTRNSTSTGVDNEQKHMIDAFMKRAGSLHFQGFNPKSRCKQPEKRYRISISESQTHR